MEKIEKVSSNKQDTDTTIKDNKLKDSSESIGFVSLKVFTILFAFLSVFDFVYYLVKEGLAEKWTQFLPLFIMICYRIPAFVFITFLLVKSKSIGYSLVLLFLSVYSFMEITIVWYSFVVIDYHKNIIGLNFNLISLYFDIIMAFRTYLKMRSDEEISIERCVQRNKKPTENEILEKQKTEKPETDRDRLTCLHFMEQNSLVFAAIVSISIAISSGLSLRWISKKDSTNLIEWTQRDIKYVGFLGEIFLRILSSLIIPMIMTSLVYALATMKIRQMYKMAIRITGYYFLTTFLAVILGIILVSIIRPGYHGSPLERDRPSNSEPQPIMADVIMDLIR